MIDKYKQQYNQKVKKQKENNWEQMQLPFENPERIPTKIHSMKHYGWSRTFTDQEINDLFWNTLVNLGWKIDGDTFILTCSECDTPLKKINKKELENDSITITLQFSDIKLAEHKPKCKGTSEVEEI